MYTGNLSAARLKNLHMTANEMPGPSLSLAFSPHLGPTCWESPFPCLPLCLLIELKAGCSREHSPKFCALDIPLVIVTHFCPEWFVPFPAQVT